jgi:ElaB/YqjD/DUF883 family membrane-anchored ribosome-binding protein
MSYPPFDLYREEFTSLVKQIEQRFHAEEDVSDLLSQCDELLPQMALEARGAPFEWKQELRDILQACRMQLATYQSLNNQKDELFENAKQKNNDGRMLPQDRVGRQNAQLEASLRSIRETEQVATEVSQELYRNRETLQSAQDNVGELSSMTEQAKGLLKSMSRKWF